MSTPPDLGPLPGHPEPQTMTWTELEREVIRAERQRCYMLGVAAASQWRPIETAPKDGTVILAFRALPCGPEMSSVAWKHKEHAFGNSGWHYPEWNGPTHWMPLPSAPTKEGG